MSKYTRITLCKRDIRYFTKMLSAVQLMQLRCRVYHINSPASPEVHPEKGYSLKKTTNEGTNKIRKISRFACCVVLLCYYTGSTPVCTPAQNYKHNTHNPGTLIK